MAAEVSSFSRMANVCMEEAEEGTELVTRDLLGSAASSSPEVDLELQVPAGWSGNSYLQQRKTGPAPRHLHVDLNFSPPSPSSAPQCLKSLPAFSVAPDLYHSVCTLEKVKSALERESRLVVNTSPPFAPRSERSPSPPSPSPSHSSATTITITTCSSTTKRRPAAEQHEDSSQSTCGGPAMAVAACPGCLLYVLICKADPRCPKCAVGVPINHLDKKPRIDLNFSLRAGNNRSYESE